MQVRRPHRQFSRCHTRMREDASLNNNRNSNNNRRRGRNNSNRQSGSGGGNQLNRIDSRTRGNAPQLLDKYKKLAQDAQHNGDRVQAEYFLQFADHYFRVINDNKTRQDEARAQRGERVGRDDQNDGAGGSDGDQNNGSGNASRGPRDDDDSRRPRRSRPQQDDDDSRDDSRDNNRYESRDDSRDYDSDNDQDDDRYDSPRHNRDRSTNDCNDRSGGRTSNDRSGGRAANGRSPVQAKNDDDRDAGNDPERDQVADDYADTSDTSDRAPARQPRAKVERAPRKPRAVKAAAAKPESGTQEEFDISALPPSIGRSSDEEPAKKKPALRPRRKRATDTETVD